MLRFKFSFFKYAIITTSPLSRSYKTLLSHLNKTKKGNRVGPTVWANTHSVARLLLAVKAGVECKANIRTQSYG